MISTRPRPSAVRSSGLCAALRMSSRACSESVSPCRLAKNGFWYHGLNGKRYECINNLRIDRSKPCPGLENPMCLVNWQAIEMGHTDKQITQYLGEPHLKSSTAGKQIWAYELMLGQAATITMVSNRVVAVSKPEISQLLFTAPYDRGSAAK
jgi:hypothetical protein